MRGAADEDEEPVRALEAEGVVQPAQVRVSIDHGGVGGEREKGGDGSYTRHLEERHEDDRGEQTVRLAALSRRQHPEDLA